MQIYPNTMRIAPNHPRLRFVSLCCWAFASWWMVQLGTLSSEILTPLFAAGIILTAALLFALGVAFWVIATDRRASVLLDSKGLMFNMGSWAAFVAWENIAAVGVCEHRQSLLSLGSFNQFGLKLHRPEEFVQSYEERLPASTGLFAIALRLLQRVVQLFTPRQSTLKVDDLLRLRNSTGYDVVVPEALLGGKAAAFVELVQSYRSNPQARHGLRLNAISFGE
ncbi:MAG: hypothetical protein MUD01_12390 [Chloroflexaceae bacterium]|nr:hypothetical protein [Chloroflexaceae bacterium]